MMRTLKRFFLVVLLVGCAVAGMWAFHALEQFSFENWGRFALAVLLYSSLITFVGHVFGRPGATVLLKVFVSVVGLAVATGVLFTGLTLASDGLIGLLQSPSSRGITFPALTVLIVLGSGALLYWFRREFRSTYGLVEVVVGVAVALAQSSQLVSEGHSADAAFMLALMTAGVYLVVRGLDNVEQGLGIAKDPMARLVKKILKVTA